MLPKSAGKKLQPGPPKGKLGKKGPPAVPPGPPQAQPPLKAGLSKKLKGMS